MASFNQTPNPTNYGFFDSDAVFQFEADSAVKFVKTRLSDDIVQVELSSRSIFCSLEEAFLEYGMLVSQYQAQSQISTLLGLPNAFSGTVVSGALSSSFSATGLYPQTSFEFIMRQADAYAAYAGLGGQFETTLTYIELEVGRQDYDLYSELKFATGSMMGQSYNSNLPSSSAGTKIRVFEIFHNEPLAAQSYLLNSSNVTNLLASEINYESYVNATVFYVLPVFEDVLRRQSLEMAHRIRRSNYTYKITGGNLRIFPIPYDSVRYGNKVYLRVGNNFDNYSAINPAEPQAGYLVPGSGGSVIGARISNPSQLPFTIIPPHTINEIGRQWIRQYCLAICKEILGRARSKYSVIPIPGDNITLDGDKLIAEGREDMERLRTSFKEFLDDLTYEKIIAKEAEKGKALLEFQKLIPIVSGKGILIG